MKDFIKKISSIPDSVKILRTVILILAIALVIQPLMLLKWTVNKLEQRDKYTYVLSQDGKAIAAELTTTLDRKYLEAEAMSKLFILLFFEVEKSNYETKVLKAFALGNNSLKELYTHFEGQDWWSKLGQLSLIQTVDIVSVRATSMTNPYIVECNFITTINQSGMKSVKYDINLVLTMQQNQGRTTENPYALTITNTEFKKFSRID